MSIYTDRRWSMLDAHIVWIGSESGGAGVDLSLLSTTSVVYSFGLAFEISFDRGIINKTNGCSVFGYDPDSRSIEWLQREDVYVTSQMKFYQNGLAAKAGIFKFGITDPESMAGSLVLDGYEHFIDAEFKTLEQIMSENGHSIVDFVKMDIEGSEFALFGDCLGRKYSPPIRQLWIEFHPETQNMSIEDVETLVLSLDAIGLIPIKRVYRKSPRHFLLRNINL